MGTLQVALIAQNTELSLQRSSHQSVPGQYSDGCEQAELAPTGEARIKSEALAHLFSVAYTGHQVDRAGHGLSNKWMHDVRTNTVRETVGQRPGRYWRRTLMVPATWQQGTRADLILQGLCTCMGLVVDAPYKLFGLLSVPNAHRLAHDAYDATRQGPAEPAAGRDGVLLQHLLHAGHGRKGEARSR